MPFNAHRQPQTRGFLVNAWGWKGDGLWSMYQGGRCFLCCGGPSLAELPLEQLNQRGIVTAAVNQCGATHVRPDLWFCVDTPASFHETIWSDGGVMKFVRRSMSRHRPRRWQNGEWKPVRQLVRHYPNVWFYEHAFGAEPDTFLTHPRVFWGFDYPIREGVMRQVKSVLLVALRMLYWLGIRTVYLCGADFHMTPEKTYAFDEPKDTRASGYNNNSYNFLNHFFKAARPKFDEAGFHVLNVTPGSKLDAFDRMDFTDAVNQAASQVPAVETVRGLYG